MRTFSVGDSVVFVNEKQSGIVREQLREGFYRVEIEDGFDLEVSEKEITLLKAWHPLAGPESPAQTPQEKVQSNLADTQPEFVSAFEAHGCMLLALIPERNKVLTGQAELWLINGSDEDYCFSAFLAEEYLAGGLIQTKSSLRIGLKKFAAEAHIACHFLRLADTAKGRTAYRKEVCTLETPDLHQQFPKLSAPWCYARTRLLFSQQADTPLDLSGLLSRYQEDLEKVSSATKPAEKKSVLPAGSSGKGPFAVDLHIEELAPEQEGLDHSHMLQIQLKAFRKALDQAILARNPRLVLIHGVGNGRLKTAIRNELKELKLSFRDADYSRYGSGATEVMLH